MQILLVEAIIVLFLICITIAVMTSVDLFACTILFCAFSFCAVMTYLVFGSPDVAFTEAVIGTMSTVFFAVALKSVDRFATGSRKKTKEKKKMTKSQKRSLIEKVATGIVLAVICVAFCSATKFLPEIGDADSAPNSHVSNYYIEHSKEDTGANNIVSGTLADYRGYDTMFETSVMFVSGLVVTLILIHGTGKMDTPEILGRKKKKDEEKKEE
ncbi:MAG: DUF4040 domain-containing protein [Eubacterium sp.]|nr:DUF4040 domain-containing protein [Eubacterium sp.]